MQGPFIWWGLIGIHIMEWYYRDDFIVQLVRWALIWTYRALIGTYILTHPIKSWHHCINWCHYVNDTNIHTKRTYMYTVVNRFNLWWEWAWTTFTVLLVPSKKLYHQAPDNTARGGGIVSWSSLPATLSLSGSL